MQSLALAAIRAYQRFISPRKGFCCAYRTHTGHASCSNLGFRAIRRHGLARGWLLLRRRLYLCGVAHRRYGPASRRPLAAQRGACDVDCGSADSSGLDCDVGDCACDALDVADCSGCGGRSRDSKKKSKDESAQRLPPQRTPPVDDGFPWNQGADAGRRDDS